MDRRQLRDFDVALFLAALVLVAIGLLMVHSATHGGEGAGASALVKRQLVVACLALVLLGGTLFVTHDTLEALSPDP